MPEIQSGLNDELTEFTVLEDNDSISNIDAEKENQEESEENQTSNLDDEDTFFDINEIPEDQREAFSGTYGKMQKAFKDKTAKNDGEQQRQAALVNTLVEKLNATVSSQQAPPGEKSIDAAEKRRMKFKFEEGDYYKPAFEEIAGVLSGLATTMEGLKTGYLKDRQTDYQESIKTFFSSNKVNPVVVKKMDEIALEYGKDVNGNFVAFKNLPKLHRLAKKELGMLTNVPNKPNQRNQVESKSRNRSTPVREKPAETMQEAWKQAEQQLREK